MTDSKISTECRAELRAGAGPVYTSSGRAAELLALLDGREWREFPR